MPVRRSSVVEKLLAVVVILAVARKPSRRTEAVQARDARRVVLHRRWAASAAVRQRRTSQDVDPGPSAAIQRDLVDLAVVPLHDLREALARHPGAPPRRRVSAAHAQNASTAC
jgi:hypothetical protein